MKKIRAVMMAIFAIAAMSMFALVGCSSNDNAATEASEDSSAAATESVAEPEVVSGTVTTDIDMTDYEQGKVVRVWIPVAQTNEHQTVGEATFEAETAATAEITTDEHGNKMLYVEWDADADPATRTATVSFDAERTEILRPELVEEGTAGSDLDEYLQGTEMVVVDGEIKELADEIVGDETTYLGRAQLIYDWVYENMNRDEDVTGCGQGDVCALIETKAGKCTDINSMFVALCRAAGVPAREMFGIRMNDADITKNQHCWAEFYLPGTGWVAADPADVLKAVLKNDWSKDSDEALETKDYYWGNNDAKRVELSSGRDLVLSPAQAGAPLNDFGYPYAEVDDEVVDFYSPDTFKYSISFAEAA